MCIATATPSLSQEYQNAQSQLLDAGILISLGVPGLYGHSGVFEAVVDHFERLVTRRGAHLQAEVMRFPALLARKHYLQTSHIENFPDLMGSVHSFNGNELEHLELLDQRNNGEDWTGHLSPSELMLTPAACYPLYPTATGTLPEGGRTIDLRAFVFRHEPSPDPARMQCFSQREYVRLGTAQEALDHRALWLQLGEQILNEVGLKVERVVANDPFFGRAGKVMAKSQIEQDLKYELVFPVASHQKLTAITSCNYHLDYFGRAFGIRTADGNFAHSACIGFGLERIALALFMKYGFDPDQWPADVKNGMGI